MRPFLQTFLSLIAAQRESGIYLTEQLREWQEIGEGESGKTFSKGPQAKFEESNDPAEPRV